MAIDLDAEIAKIEGRYLDLDGAPRQAPYQCHDVWLWLLYLVGGIPGDGYAPDDDTVSVWTRFPVTAHVGQLFTRHEGAAGIRRGDVLFWKRGTWYPGTHTAVALGPVRGELVPCLTQNPGPVRRADLITRDLVGYLRPIAPIAGVAGTTNGDDMARILNMRETPDGKINTATIFFDGGPGVGIKGISSPYHLGLLQRFIADAPGDHMFPAELAVINSYYAPGVPTLTAATVEAAVTKAIKATGGSVEAAQVAAAVESVLKDDFAAIPAATAATMADRLKKGA